VAVLERLYRRSVDQVWLARLSYSPALAHPGSPDALITGQPLTQQSQVLLSVLVALPQSSVIGFMFAISADQSQLAFGKLL